MDQGEQVKSLVQIVALLSAMSTLCWGQAESAGDLDDRFPAKLSGFELQDTTQYEDSRLGRSFAYSTRGIEATVYVYDHGLERVPRDIESPIVRGEFESAKASVELSGQWENVVHLDDNVVVAGKGERAVSVLLSRFTVTQSGRNALSYLYLFGADDNFIKLRLTCDLPRRKCDNQTQRFVGALTELFPPTSDSPIPREKIHEMVETLIADPYGEHAEALGAILYAYVDKIRPEFVLCVSQFAPLLDSGNEDHTRVWIQIAISSGDYLLANPEAIENEYRYQLAGF